jgi:hypothetical protein
VVEDDAVVVVRDLGLVAELDRLAESALADRAGVRVVQADPPGRAVGGVALNPLPGLRDDLPRRGQQFLQVVDRADEPAPAPPRRRIALTPSGRRRRISSGGACGFR